MKMGIVILHVQDIERSRRFYTEVVGLPVDEQQSDANFTMLATDGSLLALQAASSLPEGQDGQAGGVEVGLELDGVDATYKRWKKAGVELLGEPETRPFGRYFLARDPDGHYLSVYGKP